MKKILLFVATIALATLGYGQQPFATLTHNDTIRVFHGLNALQQAHAAAVDGDFINLSSGAFNSVNITKAVTIRGAGMFNDNSTGLVATTIRNPFTVTVPDTLHRLSLIGLYFLPDAEMTIYMATNPQFVKCRFQIVSANRRNDGTTTIDNTRNAQFINCIIGNWNNNQHSSWRATGTGFYNSIVLQFYNEYSPAILVNCIAKLGNPADYLMNKSILNCVLYMDYDFTGVNNGYTSFNTIGINVYYMSGRYYYDLTNMSTHNLHNYTNYAQVFQTFRGTYSDGMNMALNANIASTILGDDSTQVGIYGGQFPWDPVVSNPLIGHISASRRTNAQGKLEVDVEIINNDDDE